MKQLFIATASITLLLGISGCKSTSKADSANPPPNSRANESVLEHMGNDAGAVIESAGDAIGDAGDAIGDAVDAIGKGGAAVIDSFKSDKDKSDHPGS